MRRINTLTDAIIFLILSLSFLMVGISIIVKLKKDFK